MRPWLERGAARLYEPLLHGVLETLRRRTAILCAEAAAAPGAPVPGRTLDCCCGPGGLLPLLRQRGLSVTGVDLSPFMLEAARRRLPETPLIRADARRLPFADGIFGAATLCLSLHAMRAPGDALEECLRVARLTVLADYRLAERHLDLPAAALAAGAERLAGGEHHANYGRFMAAGGLEGLLRRHGCRVLHRERALGGAATLAVVTRQQHTLS